MCVHIYVFKEVSLVWKMVCSSHIIIYQLGHLTVIRLFCVGFPQLQDVWGCCFICIYMYRGMAI